MKIVMLFLELAGIILCVIAWVGLRKLAKNHDKTVLGEFLDEDEKVRQGRFVKLLLAGIILSIVADIVLGIWNLFK